MGPDLSTTICGLRLKNPIMAASGTFGYGLEYVDYYEPDLLGAIITKGLSLYPQEGNTPPRIVETPCGMLNSIGLANIGVERFVEEVLPVIKEINTHIIVNVYGHTVQDYQEVAKRLNLEGISALEVNISCPNVEKGGMLFGADPKTAYGVIRAVKQVSEKPVIAKLSPNVTDIVAIAKAVEDAGADAISLINTLRGMTVDVRKRRPRLGTVFGGLSGPAIRPVALYMVYRVVKAVGVDVIGIGGIVSGEDALEFLIVGAKAVEIGSANFMDPMRPINILRDIEAFLEEEGIASLAQIIGTLKEV